MNDIILAFYPPRPATMQDFFPAGCPLSVPLSSIGFVGEVPKELQPWFDSVTGRILNGLMAKREIVVLAKFATRMVQLMEHVS